MRWRIMGDRGRPVAARWKGMAGLLALLVAGLLAWKGEALRARAGMGAAYGARVACSCRYVEGRSMASCAGDLRTGMRFVRVSDSPEDRAVTGSVPLLASRTARYRPGFGCLMDP